MTNYKLNYFNARGVAEPARLLFAQAGVQYEDVRFTSEEWAKVKSNTAKFPLGQAPVLEVDGLPLFQSAVIVRYLAREFGMYGKNNREMARVDLISETIRDMGMEMYKIMQEKDDAKKAEMYKTFGEGKGKLCMDFFTRALEKNNEGKGYFVGSEMTVADILVFNHLDGMERKKTDALSTRPLLKSFLERMKKEPKIAGWLAKRPQTEF